MQANGKRDTQKTMRYTEALTQSETTEDKSKIGKSLPRKKSYSDNTKDFNRSV